jgi:prepilin peptidase CpaA
MPPPIFTTSPVSAAGGAVFTTLLICACVSDLRRRRIPNQVVVLLAVTGLIYSCALARSPTHGVLLSIAALLLGLALWLPLYAVQWLGAGDVKLFAAAGAWLGPLRSVQAALIAALAGGVLAAVWMVRAYGAGGTVTTVAIAVTAPRSVVNHGVDVNSRRAIPYGVALSIGAVTAAWFPAILTWVFHAAH